MDNDKLFNKFPTDSNYVANQFTAPTQNVSLRGNPRQLIGAGTRPASLSGMAADNANITQNGLVVNNELPHISTLYEGLTPYQAKALDSVIKRGAEKNTNKLGSLDSLNRIKQELNADIIGSQQANPANRLGSVDTPDTVALREVKKRVDKALGDTLKGRDKGYHKAKSMEEAYNAGRSYNPNATNNDALIPNLDMLEKNAFAQGLFRKMTNNPITGENLANKALKYENVLNDVLPQNRYNSLMDGLNRESVRFNRLAGLGRKAENKLVLPEKDRLFAREQFESKGSMLGSAVDLIDQMLRGRTYEKAAQNLLNPQFIGKEGSWLMENYPTLSTYISGMFANEN